MFLILGTFMLLRVILRTRKEELNCIVKFLTIGTCSFSEGAFPFLIPTLTIANMAVNEDSWA